MKCHTWGKICAKLKLLISNTSKLLAFKRMEWREFSYFQGPICIKRGHRLFHLWGPRLSHMWGPMLFYLWGPRLFELSGPRFFHLWGPRLFYLWRPRLFYLWGPRLFWALIISEMKTKTYHKLFSSETLVNLLVDTVVRWYETSTSFKKWMKHTTA